jgi:drug/metabolite transporter (DMT)-like permease
MELLYVAALIVGLTVAFALVFGIWLKHQPAKRRIGGWLCVVVGVAFVVIHALETEQQLFVLAIGLGCLGSGVFALSTSSTQGTNASGPS